MATTYGVYIHIPFCKSKCDYCDFYSLAGREEEMDHYQKALIAQLRSFAPRLKGRVADTIYFGGGTPWAHRPPTPNSCAVCTASTPPGKWSRPWRTFGGRRSRTSA